MILATIASAASFRMAVGFVPCDAANMMIFENSTNALEPVSHSQIAESMIRANGAFFPISVLGTQIDRPDLPLGLR